MYVQIFGAMFVAIVVHSCTVRANLLGAIDLTNFSVASSWITGLQAAVEGANAPITLVEGHFVDGKVFIAPVELSTLLQGRVIQEAFQCQSLGALSSHGHFERWHLSQ